MKVWLPYVVAGSGLDVYTKLLAKGFAEAGVDVEVTAIPHKWQYLPWRMKLLSPPDKTDVILTNSWNGFAFKRSSASLVVVEHHCVFDPAYMPYRSSAQGAFHDSLVRKFELASFNAANAIIAVSQYTANSLKNSLGVSDAVVIHNGIDTDFFCPSDGATEQSDSEPFRILFVGNPSRRKGADLLLPIMEALGDGFELVYTSGLRKDQGIRSGLRLKCLGRLSNEELRDEYRKADVLLFPSRLEGFGYAAAEAMACGTPVVTSNCSSLPEVVKNGETGLLCPIDDVDAFVAAIRQMAAHAELAENMGTAGRRWAVEGLSLDTMAASYITLFEDLQNGATTKTPKL